MVNAQRFMFNRLVDFVIPGAGVFMDMLDAAELASELQEAGETMETFQDVKEAKQAASNTLRAMVEKKGIEKNCRAQYGCGSRLKVLSRGTSCDRCWATIKDTTPHLGCASCNYDLCAACSLEDDDDDDGDDERLEALYADSDSDSDSCSDTDSDYSY